MPFSKVQWLLHVFALDSFGARNQYSGPGQEWSYTLKFADLAVRLWVQPLWIHKRDEWFSFQLVLIELIQ